MNVMKRIVMVGVIMLASSLYLSAKNFIYLRYDHKACNISELINYIQNIIAGDDYVIYMSNGANPFIARDMEDWNDLKGILRSASFEFDYHDYEDLCKINSEFESLFKEQVNDGHIVGSYDNEWCFYCIMSEKMWKIDSKFIPSRLYSVNELDKRMNIKNVEYKYDEKTGKYLIYTIDYPISETDVISIK